jgi:hypothetical protein
LGVCLWAGARKEGIGEADPVGLPQRNNWRMAYVNWWLGKGISKQRLEELGLAKHLDTI